LNISFINKRRDYNRKRNLLIICEALKEINSNIDVKVNDRDDLILEEKWKISGSAARLLRNEALHHCTLLVDANVETLNSVLSSTAKIDTVATPSLRVDVKCLSEAGIPSVELLDGPLSTHWKNSYYKSDETIFESIDPTDLPYVIERVKELKTWNWIYGTTPKFYLQTGQFSVSVNKGIIETVRMANGLELPSFEGIKLQPDEINSPLYSQTFESKTENEFLNLIINHM